MHALRAAASLVLLYAADAGATDVRIRPLFEAVGGGQVASAVDIRLVDGGGKDIRGIRTTDGAAVQSTYRGQIAADGSPLVISLVPQPAIAWRCGSPTCPTWYRVTRSAPGVPAQSDLVQVPDSPTVLELSDLIGAAAVPAADLAAGRTLTIAERAALDAAAHAPDGNNPLATLADVAAGGGGGGGGGTWGSITGTLGAQLDLASALAGLQPAGAYLTAETDPVFGASAAAGITGTQAAHWDSAYGWGDHAAAGYQETGAPGVAGLLPVVALGDSTDVALALDGHAYTARLVGDGDLSVSAPPAGAVAYTVLYLTSDSGAWELSTPAVALWIDGTPETLAPAVGETWEILARVLPDGSLLLSARIFQ